MLKGFRGAFVVSKSSRVLIFRAGSEMNCATKRSRSIRRLSLTTRAVRRPSIRPVVVRPIGTEVSHWRDEFERIERCFNIYLLMACLSSSSRIENSFCLRNFSSALVRSRLAATLTFSQPERRQLATRIRPRHARPTHLGAPRIHAEPLVRSRSPSPRRMAAVTVECHLCTPWQRARRHDFVDSIMPNGTDPLYSLLPRGLPLRSLLYLLVFSVLLRLQTCFIPARGPASTTAPSRPRQGVALSRMALTALCPPR